MRMLAFCGLTWKKPPTLDRQPLPRHMQTPGTAVTSKDFIPVLSRPYKQRLTVLMETYMCQFLTASLRKIHSKHYKHKWKTLWIHVHTAQKFYYRRYPFSIFSSLLCTHKKHSFKLMKHEQLTFTRVDPEGVLSHSVGLLKSPFSKEYFIFMKIWVKI